MPEDGEEEIEEAVSENKLILDNLTEVVWLLKISFGFFYHIDPSMIWSLKLKKTVEEGLVSCENIFLEIWKSKKSGNNYNVYP